MSTAYAEPNPAAQPPPQRPYEDPSGLGPRKTIFVLCTVAGCIAILWPKIFHPMMFGADDASPTNNLPNINNIHNLRPGGKFLSYLSHFPCICCFFLMFF